MKRVMAWLLSRLIPKEIIEKLKGKKTYITAAMIGIAAALQHLGYDVPDYVWEILMVTGLVTIRAGITKSAPPQN